MIVIVNPREATDDENARSIEDAAAVVVITGSFSGVRVCWDGGREDEFIDAEQFTVVVVP